MLLNLEGAPYAEVFLYVMVSIKFPNTDDDQRTFVILVQATSNDNVPLCEFGNKISDANAIREIDLSGKFRLCRRFSYTVYHSLQTCRSQHSKGP